MHSHRKKIDCTIHNDIQFVVQTNLREELNLYDPHTGNAALQQGFVWQETL